MRIKKQPQAAHSRRTAPAGFGLVEIVVFLSVLAIAFVALFNVGVFALNIVSESHQKMRAAFLLEEGMEAVRLLRDREWSNVTGIISGNCLEFSGDDFITTNTPPCAKIDGLFERTASVQNVNRNGDSDIAPTGTDDPNTKLLTITVTWEGRKGTKSESMDFYITNLFGT